MPQILKNLVGSPWSKHKQAAIFDVPQPLHQESAKRSTGLHQPKDLVDSVDASTWYTQPLLANNQQKSHVYRSHAQFWLEVEDTTREGIELWSSSARPAATSVVLHTMTVPQPHACTLSLQCCIVPFAASVISKLYSQSTGRTSDALLF
jgi:hypothetical protein